MKTISTIGVHLAKRVFQVHGADEEGHIIVKQKAVLAPACGPQHSPPPAGIPLWSFAQPTGQCLQSPRTGWNPPASDGMQLYTPQPCASL
jgi:hypothetical protein